MGSRPSKFSPSSLNLQRHVFREETTFLASSTPYASRSSDVSVWPRSVVRFSKVPEQPEDGYFTPRPRGRSAIYKMSRSPYFKVPAKPQAKVCTYFLWVKQLSYFGAYLFSNSGIFMNCDFRVICVVEMVMLAPPHRPIGLQQIPFHLVSRYTFL